MRILYLTNAIIPSREANSIQVMRMAQAFTRNGHSVTLVARIDDASIPAEDPYNYYGIKPTFDIQRFEWPRSRVGGLLYGWHIYRWLKDYKGEFDLAYSRSVYGMGAAILHGCPCIYEAHTFPQNVARRLLEVVLLRSRSALRLVTISGALREEYLRRFPKALSSIDVVVAHDGADISTFLPDQDLNLPGRGDAIRVGYVGSLYPGKGVETVIELAKMLTDFDFHVVGGTESDLGHWRSKVNLSNLFFHGYVKPSDVHRYYTAFDILILPCKSEVTVYGKGNIAPWMSPLKLFEYMSSGRPIVAARLPVLEEVLVDRQNCLLVDPEDIHAWKSALLMLSRTDDLAEYLATNARKDLQLKYSWDKRVERVLNGIE